MNERVSQAWRTLTGTMKERRTNERYLNEILTTSFTAAGD